MTSENVLEAQMDEKRHGKQPSYILITFKCRIDYDLWADKINNGETPDTLLKSAKKELLIKELPIVCDDAEVEDIEYGFEEK